VKNKKLFKLIDGNFSTKEGRELLRNLFTSKIHFHQMKSFSSQERFGKDDETALKRTPQLKDSLEKILKMIELAEKQGQQLEINSSVIVRFVQPDKNG
jgi:hypothetical protein